jgi:hypothetical protein
MAEDTPSRVAQLAQLAQELREEFTLFKEKTEEKFTLVEQKFSASQLASRVLTLLLSEENPTTTFNWSGPKKSKIGKGDLFVVGLQVLGALVAFIENEHTSKAL